MQLSGAIWVQFGRDSKHFRGTSSGFMLFISSSCVVPHRFCFSHAHGLVDVGPFLGPWWRFHGVHVSVPRPSVPFHPFPSWCCHVDGSTTVVVVVEKSLIIARDRRPAPPPFTTVRSPCLAPRPRTLHNRVVSQVRRPSGCVTTVHNPGHGSFGSFRVCPIKPFLSFLSTPPFRKGGPSGSAMAHRWDVSRADWQANSHAMRTHGKHSVSKEQNEKHKKVLEKMLQREENRCVPRPRRTCRSGATLRGEGEGNEGV